VLRVQFGFQSVISAFQTDEQKNHMLNWHKSEVHNEILTTLISKRDETLPECRNNVIMIFRCRHGQAGSIEEVAQFKINCTKKTDYQKRISNFMCVS
jgi:hypothetical protein